MSIRIEVVTPQAVHSALPLLESQFDEHDISLGPGALEAAVRELVSQPSRGAVLLALEASQGSPPVGVAVLAYTWTLEHAGLVSWLDELYVVPSRRGHGVGGALLAAALETARAAGCRAMELEVEAAHQRAERLYERAGFARHTRTRFVRSLRDGAGP